MNQALRAYLIWFLALAMTACQIMPPGTQTQSDLTGGFQIQGRGKPDLKPLLSCVSQSRDGSLLAHFSYENTLGKTMTLPVGGQNKFLENPGWGKNEHPQNHTKHDFSVQSNKSNHKQDEHHSSHKDKQDQHSDRHGNHHSNRRDNQDRGQITLFPPGAGPSWPQSAFSVAFTQDRLTWQLGNHSVTAYARDLSQRCKEEAITVGAHTVPRKTLLSAQTVTLTQNQQVFNFSFQASDISDLRRRIAINLINGPDGSPRVDELRIYVNKQPLLAQRPEASFLKAEVPNMITEIFNTQFGNNNLELELRGPVGAQMRFSVEGFLRTVFIPGAFHSAIDDHTLIRKAPIHKGIVGIKFMEGMKVRLGQAVNQWERLSDETGISLMPLQAMIGYHQISDIVPALPGSVEERDAMEQRAESETGHEAPNQNLFYYLYFDESKDVWEMVDRLSTLPFIEEAYPMFIFSSAQATTTAPTLSPFVPDEVKPSGGLSGNFNTIPTPVPHSLWLKSTRIMNSHAGLPTPSPSASPSAAPLAGAWDITQGSSSIKVAALEHGYNKNHEDLGKIQQLVNVSPGSGYTDLDHGTKTMGVIGASKDTSGRGSIGVAHGASVYHIWPWDNQFGSPSLCRGTGAAKCHPTVDALEYAKKEKMQVVLISATGGGLKPGTVEEYDPPVRSHIQQKITPENIAVIVQAGNRACEGIKNSDEFKECTAFFKNGKNIKEIIVREKYLDMRGCQEPSLIANIHPLIGGLMGLGYLHCINTTPPIVKEKFSSQGDMPDTGSIIVGALKVDGSAMVPPDPPGTSTSTLPYNHGKSRASSDGLETIGGHGTDISGPSEYIYTATYDSKSNSSYGYFGGTSGASPVITGVVALMLSVNPTLKPKEIRKILRETQQPLPSGEDISGMVDAYEAVKIAQSLPGGFKTASLLPPPAGATPGDYGVKAFYDPNNPGPITARAGDVIGFFVQNARTRNISIEIQGKNAVVTANHDDLLSMTVPADLIVGNVDATFKSAEGEFKIENLINYTSPFPEVVKFSKPTIFANGGDVVDGYITVKDANGQPAPDGTPYYVQLVPTQLGLYPDLTMIHPETGQQYGGRWTTVEQVLPVKNGKIHIQAKLTAPIGPYEYTYDFSNSLPNVFTWPHANAPSFQVQVCNPAYNSNKPGYGYYCGQQLFPQAGNTLDGRLYAVHAYSFDPQIQQVTAGSLKRTITIRNIKDILGNPVPVGTVLHFNQTYWGTVSNPNGNDIYWGATVQTPGEVEIVYEPLQRLSCGLVGVEEQVYITTVQGAVGNPLHWLVGNPLYFRYVAC